MGKSIYPAHCVIHEDTKAACCAVAGVDFHVMWSSCWMLQCRCLTLTCLLPLFWFFFFFLLGFFFFSFLKRILAISNFKTFNSHSSFSAQKKQSVSCRNTLWSSLSTQFQSVLWLYTYKTMSLSLLTLKLVQSCYIFNKVKFWLLSFSASCKLHWVEMVFLLYCIPRF